MAQKKIIATYQDYLFHMGFHDILSMVGDMVWDIMMDELHKKQQNNDK